MGKIKDKDLTQVYVKKMLSFGIAIQYKSAPTINTYNMI